MNIADIGYSFIALSFFVSIGWIMYQAISGRQTLTLQGESVKGHSYRDAKQMHQYQQKNARAR